MTVWHAWDRKEKLFLAGEGMLVADLLAEGVRWMKKAESSGDYPIFRLTPQILAQYGVRTVKDLDKVPFVVYWPQEG